MGDKELTLVQFQEITGLEDVGKCIALLDKHKWNLEVAIQSHFANADQVEPWSEPAHQQPSSSTNGGAKQVPPRQTNGNNGGALSQAVQSDIPADFSEDCDSFAGCNEAGMEYEEDFGYDGSSNRQSCAARLINFIINYRDTKIPIMVPDICTVGDVKEQIKSHIAVPVDKMTLSCWVHKNDALIHDTDILRDLRLPKENVLTLKTPSCPDDAPAGQSTSVPNDYFTRTYELEIFFVCRNKSHVMKFPGSKSIQQVKEDVAVIAGPVRRQEWKGWPPGVDNSVSLAESGIGFPRHPLTVKTLDVAPATPKPPEERQPMSDEENEEDDDEEDSDDDVYDCSDCKYLMPDRAEDQLAATEHFCERFAARYGELHPVFYFGSLLNAVDDALHCNARERKLLAIYLHHDHSAHANFFCNEILCIQSTIDLLSEHFILWAWDITRESNLNILVDNFNSVFGKATANIVRMLKPEQLPTLMVASYHRGTTEVIKVILGSTSPAMVLAQIRDTIALFHDQLPDNIVEEEAREAREQVLREQETAYSESLAIDRCKRLRDEEELLKIAEQRRQEEELKRQQQLQQQKLEEDARLCEEAKKCLPVEPTIDDCSVPIISVRFCCPDDRKLTRRFLLSNNVGDLLNYVASENFALSCHKLVATFPRRDLTELDRSQTLESLNLCPKGETMIIESFEEDI